MQHSACSRRTSRLVRPTPSQVRPPSNHSPRQSAREPTNGQPDLLTVARLASQKTRFYRDLYRGEPDKLSQVSNVSVSEYHRAVGVLDCIVDREQVIGILPPYHRAGGRFPFTIPEDESELILRQQRIVRAMKDVGIDLDGPGRFLIITDESHGPFACEISKGFYWEGHQASLSYLNTADDLRRAIAQHDPDYVVLACGQHLRHTVEMPQSSVILVEHCGGGLINDWRYPAWLYADEVDLIGSRPPGRDRFDHDDSQLLIETDPCTGIAHITKLMFSCFPLVRYGLGLAVPLLSARS